MEEDVYEMYKILKRAMSEKKFVMIYVFGNGNEYYGFVRSLNHENVIIENNDFVTLLKLTEIMRVQILKLNLSFDDAMDFLKDFERENRKVENGR